MFELNILFHFLKESSASEPLAEFGFLNMYQMLKIPGKLFVFNRFILNTHRWIQYTQHLNSSASTLTMPTGHMGFDGKAFYISPLQNYWHSLIKWAKGHSFIYSSAINVFFFFLIRIGMDLELIPGMLDAISGIHSRRDASSSQCMIHINSHRFTQTQGQFIT